MLSISNALLQASGHERKPIISMAAGAVVKLLATYLLVGLKIGVDSAGKSVYLGIYGTPIGTFLCYMAISAINMYYLIKHVGVKLSFSQMFMRPLLAAVLCSAAAYGTYYFTIRFIPLYAATLLGIGIAVIIYVIAIFKLGTISREELELLPSSSKIIRILERVRLI
jgi:stage V sporulation protein B